MSLSRIKNILNELNYNYEDSAELLNIIKKFERRASSEKDIKKIFDNLISELKSFVDGRE